MVALSKHNAEAAGVADKATFMKAESSRPTSRRRRSITMFLLPSINLKLRPTILNLKPGTRIVSNTFTMDDWEPDETQTVAGDCTSWCTALLWIVPAKVEGTWQTPQGDLKLTQQFQVISGTLGSQPLTDAKLSGDAISFKAGGATYTGKVDGNTIRGTGGPGGSAWTATKK